MPRWLMTGSGGRTGGTPCWQRSIRGLRKLSSKKVTEVSAQKGYLNVAVRPSVTPCGAQSLLWSRCHRSGGGERGGMWDGRQE